jgi:hypothetical protein
MFSQSTIFPSPYKITTAAGADLYRIQTKTCKIQTIMGCLAHLIKVFTKKKGRLPPALFFGDCYIMVSV